MVDTVDTDLNVILRFLTDKESQAQAKGYIDELGDSFKLFIRQAEAAKREADQTKILEANRKKHLEIQQAIAANRREMIQLRQQAEMLQQIGIRMTMAGAAMLAPLLLASRTYINAIGQGEATSRKYIEAQERLKDVQIRLGRETTEVLLPLMEKGADLAEKFASLIEQNPALLKGFMGVGGGLIAGGTLTMLIAQVTKLIANIALLTGPGGTLAGAPALLSNPVTGMVGVAAAAGGGLYALFKELGIEEWTRVLPALGAPGTFAMMLMELDKFVSGGKSGTASKVSGRTTGAGISPSQLTSYLGYQQDEAAALVSYNTDRSSIIQTYNANMLRMEQEYQTSRARFMRDFQQNEKRIEAEYYLERKRAAADYGVEMQRMEEDHQVEMRRIAEDHDERMEDLVSSRDALGIVREMRSYERQRRDAEEDYNREASQRRQDFARRMAEMAEDFTIQRAARIQQFQQNLKDAAEDFRKKRQQAALEHRQELIDLQNKFNSEAKQRREAFVRQLQDTFDVLTKERILRAKFTAAMLADLKAAIARAGGSTTPPPARDVGGYMAPGLYRNASGLNEFVLNPQTTRAAEQMASGRLNQAVLMRLMMGGGKTVTLNDHRRFDSRLSAADRRLIRQDTAEMLGGLLG